MKNLKIAWVCPSMKLGFYIQPVLRELSKKFLNLRIFTAEWPGYTYGCEEAFEVETIGKFGHLILGEQKSDYDRSYLRLSLQLIPRLLDFKPEVIFTVGFNFWTILIAFLKPLGNWQIVVVYSGSSPNVDMIDSKIRLLARKFISRQTSAFITNSKAGGLYLENVLNVPINRIFAQPYQVPDQRSLLHLDNIKNCDLSNLKTKNTTFLFVGQIIYRKGLTYLLEACLLLNNQGCSDFSLIIVGEGSQRKEFETWSDKNGLKNQIKWEGWVSYDRLGSYFQTADVFVFPTLEDIWGMVALEAMLFAKPVLCSELAGARELVIDGENGYCFSPHKPQELADKMRRFIETPELIERMGERSKDLVSQYTPETSASHLTHVINFAINSKTAL